MDLQKFLYFPNNREFRGETSSCLTRNTATASLTNHRLPNFSLNYTLMPAVGAITSWGYFFSRQRDGLLRGILLISLRAFSRSIFLAKRVRESGSSDGQTRSVESSWLGLPFQVPYVERANQRGSFGSVMCLSWRLAGCRPSNIASTMSGAR